MSTSSPKRAKSRKNGAADRGGQAREGPGGDGRVVGKRPSTRRELVENEIYEQATRLFAERGFAGTSLQDIADALGVTRPALYYYVKSKDELLTRLVTETAENTATELADLAAREDLDPIGKLRAMTRLTVRRQANHPARFRLVIRSEAELPEGLSKEYERGRRVVLKAVAAVVDEGIRTGVFRPVDPRMAALGIIGMCNWVAWWFDPAGRDDIDAVADQFADMALGAVQRPDHRLPAGEGPVEALAMLREDIDYLERVLDV